MNDYRKATVRESYRQWVFWFRELAYDLRYAFRESWNDRPDGTTPIFVICRSCGSRCSPSRDGNCWFC